MNITSVLYKNIALPSFAATDYLLGNVGDTIYCSIFFTAAVNTFTAANFMFNFLPNSDSPTNTTNTVARRRNLQTDTELNFVCSVSQVNAALNYFTVKTPKQANAVVVGVPVLTTINVVSKTYRIDFYVQINPYLDANNATNDILTIPTYFNSSESIKPYFEITTFLTAFDTTPLDSGSNYDNVPLNAKLGNVGFFNEKFNGFAPPYELISFAYDNGLTDLDTQQIMSCTAKVKTNAGAFGGATQVFQIFCFELLDTADFQTTLDFNANQKADNTYYFAVGDPFVTSLGGKLINCKATLNGSDVDLTFDITANSLNRQFVVYAKVYENNLTSTNPNYCNVILTIDTPVAAIYEPVKLVAYPGTFTPISFLYHMSNSIDKNVNHVKGFVGDWFQGLFKVLVLNNATVSTINFLIARQSGEILDSGYLVNVGSDFATEQPYNLVSGDYRQEVRVTKVGTNYECKFAFIIREGWYAYNDIVLRVIVNGSQNGLTFGGDAFTWNSPAFVLQNYELTLNTITEPRALGYTTPQSSKQFSLASNPLIKGDFIFAGYDSFIEYFFRDDNLNDLQAVLSDLVAYFTINYNNGNENTKRSIHSLWGNGVNSPFTEPAGGVATFAKIDIISIKEAKISANILWAKIQELGFGNAKLKITGRLDRIMPPQYLERYLLHLRGNNAVGNFRPYISFTSVISAFSVTDVLGATIGTMLYKYSELVTPNWDIIIPVSEAVVLSQIALGSGTYKLMPFPTINSLYSECTLIFTYAKTGTAPANTWSYNFANAISIDTVIGFDNRINISSLTGSSASSTWYRIRTNPAIDWNVIGLETSLVTLNAQIAAQPIGTAFELQLINIARNTLILTYTYL